jgi:hypothetical protein
MKNVLDWNYQGADDLAIAIFQHSGNLTEPQRECGADKGRERQYAPALEQPYSVPDHTAGDEGQRAGRLPAAI